jgi:hypothetical protein
MAGYSYQTMKQPIGIQTRRIDESPPAAGGTPGADAATRFDRDDVAR